MYTDISETNIGRNYVALAYMTGILPVKKVCNPTKLDLHSVNYWTSTETYEALKIYMDMDFDGLRSDITQLLGGGRVRVNTRSFQNDMRNFRTKDDILTLLIHLGYLGYDARNKEVFIPNKEIIEEYENAMSMGGWPEVIRVLKASGKLLEDILNGDAKVWRRLTGRIQRSLPYSLTMIKICSGGHRACVLQCAKGLQADQGAADGARLRGYCIFAVAICQQTGVHCRVEIRKDSPVSPAAD